MKKLVLLFTCIFLLSSCASPSPYKEDVSVSELCNTVRDHWDGFLLDSSSLLADYFTLPEGIREHALLYRGETDSLDEIGFFKVDKGNANALAVQLREEYLFPSYEKNRTFYDSYMPNETPKLKNAEVRVFGNYVVYAILSETDKTTLFRLLEKKLAA